VKSLKAKRLSNNIQTLALCLLSLPVIYPLVWLIANSLKTKEAMINDSWNLLPDPIVWQNYVDAWKIGRIGNSFVLSLVVSVGAVLILMAAAFLASYALARIRFAGRSFVMILFLSTWMMPMSMLAIPLFRVETVLHINNTRLGLILPYAATALPFAVFVLTTFIRTIPEEIEEAARIDGASRLRIITQICMPLAKPGLATVVIFSFMQCWNEFFLALIIMLDPDLKTLPVAMQSFNGQWGQRDFTRLFAAIVIISLPVVIVYVIFQRQFIKGLTSGAVKS
jgi:ABC-type glycerol-3-phosphate transport system permease component